MPIRGNSEPQKRIRSSGRGGRPWRDLGAKCAELRIIRHLPRIKINLRDMCGVLEIAGRDHLHKIGLFEKDIVKPCADDAQNDDPDGERKQAIRISFLLNDNGHESIRE